MINIKQAAASAIIELVPLYGQREAQQIIKILFEDLFGITNIDMIRPFEHIEQLESVLIRLKKSEPIQYITGRADFYGLQYKVNPHVLIPRPETEELVHWVLQDIAQSKQQLDILDIGVGSGCIALTIKKKKPQVRVFGIDHDMDILNVARINSRSLGAGCVFYNFDFLDKTLWPEMGKFDIIISNPPYIPDADRRIMADNVLLHEPEKALFAVEDALSFYRAIHDFAQEHLSPMGRIYLEIHEEYASDTAAIFQKDDATIEIRKDLQGKDRMIKIDMAR